MEERLQDEREKCGNEDRAAIILVDLDIRFGLRAGIEHVGHVQFWGAAARSRLRLKRGVADAVAGALDAGCGAFGGAAFPGAGCRGLLGGADSFCTIPGELGERAGCVAPIRSASSAPAA